jgi:hypothetical protein
MKKIIFALTFILLVGAVCFAQKKNKTTPENVENERPAAGNTSKRNADSRSGVLIKSGTNLDAELQGALDVRKSAVGDTVVLKTTKTIRENGEVIIPKGTKLIGRITQIQQKTKDAAVSKIGLVFEKIEGKDLSAPISASIVSITNISKGAQTGDVFSSDTSAGAAASGNASGGGNSGGGLLGGSGGLLGGAINTTTQTVGGVTGTAGNTVGGVTNTVGSAVRRLQINQAASGSASSSTTLSSPDKNLRIEKGASFQIQLN